MDTQNKTQREIKFRAWDNVEKKMLATVESWNKVWWDDTSPENEYDYHSKCLYIDNQGHVLEHTDEHGMCDMNYLLQGKPKYELMQYTGVKDKNGKEIYEGDIISVSPFVGSCIGIVEWSNNINGFIFNNGERWALPQITFHKWELIGNVYEHNYLLERSAKRRRGMLRRNRWYSLAQTTGNKTYLNGRKLTWWRRLYLWVVLTLWIVLGKESL